MNDQLTPEEREILASVERGEWRSVLNLEKEINRYQSYAQAQLGELHAVQVELPSRDLAFLQELASQAESSVSVVIANLLHQFVVHNLKNDNNTQDSATNS